MDAAWWLWPIAAAMAFVLAWLIRWSSTARTIVGAAFVVFLLAMMAAMFLGALVYVSDPGTGSLVLGLWTAGIAMSVSVFPVVALVLREAGRDPGAEEVGPRRLTSPGVLVAWVVGLVLLGELLMGRSFALAAGSATGPFEGTWAGIPTLLATTISSPWFLFPMALEMGLATLWIGPRLPAPMRAMLLVQPVLMFLSPPALPGPDWVLASAIGASVAMSAVVGYLLYLVYHGAVLPRAVGGYAVRLLLAFALMGVGLLDWAATGTTLLFGVAVVAQMAVFFSAVVVPEAFDVPSRASGEPLPAPPTAPLVSS